MKVRRKNIPAKTKRFQGSEGGMIERLQKSQLGQSRNEQGKQTGKQIGRECMGLIGKQDT